MYQPHNILVIASQFPADNEVKQGKWLETFYDRLSLHGHNVTILAPTAGASRSEFRNGVKIEWFSCYFASTLNALRELPSGSRSRNPFSIFLLPYFVMCCIATLRFARDSTFDVIHVHSFLPEGLVGLFARAVNGATLIYLAHEEEVAVGSTGFMTSYFHFFVRSANMVISNNAELAEVMKSRTSRRWNVLEYEAEAHGISNDAELQRIPQVLVVADPSQSSVSTLSKAIAIVKQQHRVKFHLAALDGNLSDFEPLSGGLGLDQNVEFLRESYHTSRNKVLSGCDVCVVVGSTMSAPKESVLRKTISEAYRSRKPVVATEFNRIHEIVIDNVTGYHVPHDDFVALADAVSNLLAHPFKRERFGESGYELLRESSAWDSIINELEDLHCIASGLPFRVHPIVCSRKSHTYA